MRSKYGFYAAVIFLAAFPVAVLGQLVFGIDAELSIHFICGTGFALMSLAVFDFKLPKLITLIGCLAAFSLAFIFLLQGVSSLLQIASLNYLAFRILGQQLESWLVKALLLWFAAVLFFDSRGKTKVLGIMLMALVFAVEFYGFYLIYRGSSLDAEFAALKLVYLLPFVWLIFESRK